MPARGAALAVLLLGCRSPTDAGPVDAEHGDAPHDASAPTPRAVFVMADSVGVFTLDADGTGRRDVVAKGTAPSWTPDGRIVYGDGALLHVIDADGAHDRSIPNPAGYAIAVRPVMAVDGTIIFMAFTTPDAVPDVWITREDGSGQRKLLTGSGAPAQPFLARSGTWFVYTVQTPRPAGSKPPYHREIWRRDLDGSNARALTDPDDTPGYPDANAPSISPDERTVAFFSGTESDDTDPKGADPSTWGPRNVATVPADGGPRTTVTDCVPLSVDPKGPCVAADNPTWSPDGKQLLFDQGATLPEATGTFVIGIDGRGKVRLVAFGRGAGAVPWR